MEKWFSLHIPRIVSKESRSDIYIMSLLPSPYIYVHIHIQDEIIPQIKRNIPPPFPAPPPRFDVTRPRRQYVSRVRFYDIFHQGFLWSIVTYPDSRSAAYHRNFADRARFTARRNWQRESPHPSLSPLNNQCPSLLPLLRVYTFTFVPGSLTLRSVVDYRIMRSSFKPIRERCGRIESS